MKDINEFKSRLKKLYEYKVYDLNLDKEEKQYHMHEDEGDQQQAQQNVEPKQPQPTTKPVEPKQPPTQQVQSTPPQPQPQKVEQQPAPSQNNNEMMMMGYLKNEMSKLDNVVDSIDKISKSVEFLSQRLENLNSSVEEIKEPSDIEKLEMRAFDSYPYNKTLSKVWDNKMKSNEEQDAERMGIYKTDDGYEMEYTPENNINKFNTSPNSFTRNGY